MCVYANWLGEYIYLSIFNIILTCYKIVKLFLLQLYAQYT